jgi:hypothetical protein
MEDMSQLFRRVLKPRGQTPELGVSSLRHIVVAGGSIEEWRSFGAPQWQNRLASLARAGKASGARFISVHPYDIGSTESSSMAQCENMPERLIIDGVQVTTHPHSDGRMRLCSVLGAWDESQEITELSLDAVLFGEAGEPDLVVVLGPPDRLPRSLMWELAYSEIVFIDQSWADLHSADIEIAIAEFASRQRRFGGVDP